MANGNRGSKNKMDIKHFCQGPECHEKQTTNRFQKKTGRFRNKYASLPINHNSTWYYSQMYKYFCGQQCANSWLAQHMNSIERGQPVVFNRERKLSEGIYEQEINDNGYYKHYTFKRVDNE